ncbi:MAG: transcription termination factor NusA [Parcubacteria group bacterium CG2_30_44_11]|nr:MAG: transcription termination factor NusA [Parcubacteria group bacterium CG2_30_44_11]
MIDLKAINSALEELENERGISRERMFDAIEQALATAYKKEYGKRGQIVRASFDMDTGVTHFNQIKIVVDETMLKPTPEDGGEDETLPDELEDMDGKLVRFDPEKHIMIENARLIKKDVALGDELIFPLENKDDFGRIAAQTAKQVIIQNVREAEKDAALQEFGQKEGDIIMGHVQRFERGSLYVDLGRITAVMPYDEQIPGERFRPGERVRAILLKVEETSRGIFLKLSRAHADFLEGLFMVEAPELQTGAVEIKAIAREAGSRSKVAVFAHDTHIDPVGSMVGQRGVRVSTVMSELGGEKIDIIEWSEDPVTFIEDALSPAQVISVTIANEPSANGEGNDRRGHAVVEVATDQQSLAIGRGGQNVRLAAKLTGWKIDIISNRGEELAAADATGDFAMKAAITTPIGAEVDVLENVDATTTEAEFVEDTPTDDRDLVDTDQIDEINEIDTPEEVEALINNEAEAAEREIEEEA